jgi:hypothetical protein
MEQIILQVKNGVVSVETLPENLELVIKDFDVTDMDCFTESVTNVNGEFLYKSGN